MIADHTNDFWIRFSCAGFMKVNCKKQMDDGLVTLGEGPEVRLEANFPTKI